MLQGKLSHSFWQVEEEKITTWRELEKKLEQNFGETKEKLKPTLADLESAIQKEINLTPTKAGEFFQLPNSFQHPLIYGDYDADGITSSYILATLLRHLSFPCQLFLPHRQNDGYGVNSKTLSRLKKAFYFDLLITIDNGVNDLPLLENLKKEGQGVAVIDHHSLKRQPSHLDFFLHNTHTSAAGLALALAFYGYQKNIISRQVWLELLQLASIGVLADQMPLRGFNYVVAKLGLESLNREGPLNPGLTALLKQASWSKEYFDEYILNFIIIPRLNAAGRIGSANLALKLLSTRKENLLESLSREIERLNHQRQLSTEEYLNDYQNEVEQLGNFLLLYQEDIPEGIIGLIANQLSQKYRRPAVVITGKGELKGSVRSPAIFHLTQTLRHFDDLFLSLGGHQKAAGFSLKEDKLEALKHSLKNERVSLKMEEKNAHFISPSLLEEKLVYLVNDYHPFGVARPRPFFFLDEFQARKIYPLGQGGKHYKLFLKQEKNSPPFLIFNLPSTFSPSTIQKLIFTPEINHFNHQQYPQFRIVDLL